jgi:hypothetical protein
LRLSRQIQIILASVGTTAIAVYLIGWHSPRSGAFESLLHPLDAAHYVISYFGTSWRQVDPTLSGVVSLLGITFMVGFCIWVLARRTSNMFLIYCGSIGGWLIITAFITALGRMNYGLEQASASRYQTPAMLFWWVCLAPTVALRQRQSAAKNLRILAVVATATMFFSMSHFGDILDTCMGRAALMDRPAGNTT